MTGMNASGFTRPAEKQVPHPPQRAGPLRNAGSWMTTLVFRVGCQDQVMDWTWLGDKSKRDSSTSRRGSFAGANEKEKAAPLRSE